MLGLRWGGGGGGGGGGAGGAWDDNDGPGEVDVCESLSDRRTACKSFSPDLTFVFARRRCMVLGKGYKGLRKDQHSPNSE